jgi:DNA-binding MarR family transcriptional regulator
VTDLPNNEKKVPIASLVERLDEIHQKLNEIETRLDNLDVKVDRIQQGNSKSTRDPTSAQVRILKYVQESPDGSTIKEIESKTGLATATVSTGLKSLIDIGAVQKVPSTEKDSRYKYITVDELPPRIRKMLELLANEY